MVLRESKIPFTGSSIPRTSGLLRKEEVLDTSIKTSEEQIQKVDQQTLTEEIASAQISSPE